MKLSERAVENHVLSGQKTRFGLDTMPYLHAIRIRQLETDMPLLDGVPWHLVY